MGLCSGKYSHRAGSQLDLFESTDWIREVVSVYQGKRKGVSKFCSFAFQPSGSWQREEDLHQVTVEFLDGKNSLQLVRWTVRVSTTQTEGPARETELIREIWNRKKILPEIQSFLSQCGYKRAKYLINIPDLIVQQDQLSGNQRRHILVLEDLSYSKMCRPPSSTLIQGGLDLAHMKIVLTSLAQFHAASLSWKQSLSDDSALDLFPFLSRPPLLFRRENILLIEKYRRFLRNISTDRLQTKLDLLCKVFRRIENPSNLEQDLGDPLGTVCVGPVSILDFSFQFSPSSKMILERSEKKNGVGDVKTTSKTENSKSTKNTSIKPTSPDIPVCAAIGRVGNLTYSSIPRDLAVWVLSLASPLVRQHYLLSLLQTYLIVLTNSLDLLGTPWEQVYEGLNFNTFCTRFFQEADYGLTVAILLAMRETSDSDLDVFLTRKGEERYQDSEREADSDEGSGDDHTTETENNRYHHTRETGTIPLTRTRVQFLQHLLDDIIKFI